MSILHTGWKEVTTIKEQVAFVLLPAVWADLPFNQEGHPDLEQTDGWLDLQRREEAEEWLNENE